MNKISYIKKKLQGPVFSIITPFKSNQEIDYDSLKRYINFLYDNGAEVFYVMFYNSRLGLLNRDEILNINKFCIQEVKKLSRKNIIICAEPYHCSTKESIKFVNYFHKNGADVVSLVFGEKFYNKKQVFSHFENIHNQSKSFLLLHQQLMENGLSGSKPNVYYSIDLLDKIMSLKKFVAMKEDAKNDLYTRKICKQISKKAIIITSGGGKKQWMKANKFGCQSWLSGVSNLNPAIAIDFLNFYKKKQKKKIQNYFKYIEKPFFKIVHKYGWHLSIKACLELNKNFKRHERQPMICLDNFNFLKVKKSFTKISKISKKVFKKDYFRI